MIREHLLETAIRHFGERGFDGASTRSIAAAADTAMSSITYHFGGKEGLYLACADYIVDKVRTRITPLLNTVEVDDSDRSGATEAVCFLLRGFANTMMSEEAAPWARFVSNELQKPTDAFECIATGAIDLIMAKVVELVGIARPDLDEIDRRSVAITIWGQAIFLRLGRASIERLLETEAMNAAAADLMIDRVVANARCILTQSPECPQ
ncbi:CerR family C-terminal domain-containing protein [Erythrobacter aureus]|uniref:CerR family C-terminal domain-containing protein n=2 Tax=Erythrobacteraceae TaxID=335929 RepID=UPI0013755101